MAYVIPTVEEEKRPHDANINGYDKLTDDSGSTSEILGQNHMTDSTMGKDHRRITRVQFSGQESVYLSASRRLSSHNLDDKKRTSVLGRCSRAYGIFMMTIAHNVWLIFAIFAFIDVSYKLQHCDKTIPILLTIMIVLNQLFIFAACYMANKNIRKLRTLVMQLILLLTTMISIILFILALTDACYKRKYLSLGSETNSDPILPLIVLLAVSVCILVTSTFYVMCTGYLWPASRKDMKLRESWKDSKHVHFRQI